MFSIIVCLASYRSVPRFQRFSYAWIASVEAIFNNILVIMSLFLIKCDV